MRRFRKRVGYMHAVFCIIDIVGLFIGFQGGSVSIEFPECVLVLVESVNP